LQQFGEELVFHLRKVGKTCPKTKRPTHDESTGQTVRGGSNPDETTVERGSARGCSKDLTQNIHGLAKKMAEE